MEGGRFLRTRSCTGAYSIFPKVDAFRRPQKWPCCPRPLCQKVVLHGSQLPPGVPLPEISEKIGVDGDHASGFETLCNMVPPMQSRLVVAKMGNLTVHNALGLPLISQDATLVDVALNDVHDALRPLLSAFPRVERLRDLHLIFPPVTSAVLLLPRNGRVVACADGRLPAIDLSSGDWLQETFFDGLAETFGILASGTRVRIAGYLTSPGGTVAVFHTSIVTDDLSRFLDGKGEAMLPQHQGLSLQPLDSVSESHAAIA